MSTPLALRIDRFTGPVHAPGDEGYEHGRVSLNPAVDAHPAVVAEALGRDDVRAAVIAAGQHGLPLAVQATGHGTHVPSDGGILLRTTLMNTVHVDPIRRVARVAAGARWGQVLAAAAPHGLAPLSGSSSDVGVVGFTLGGGVGWLSRMYGFAADSVLSAEVVTADGQVVTASRDQHPDLFWALRGGGGNFGVVTALEFRLYPVSTVYAGIARFPVTSAADVLARYRDLTAAAPRELSTAIVLNESNLAIKVMYGGPSEQAHQLLNPLWEAAGPALSDDLRPIRYAEAAMGGTPARHLDFHDTLSDQVIDLVVGASARATVEIRHWGGAMGSPGADAGPVGHRGLPYSIIATERLPELTPHGTGATFLNFLSDPSRVRTAFTAASHRRLVAVKNAYDPGNLFSLNHNIRGER